MTSMMILGIVLAIYNNPSILPPLNIYFNHAY